MKIPIALLLTIAGLGFGSGVLAQPIGFPRPGLTPAKGPAPSRSLPLNGKSKLTRNAKLPKGVAGRPAGPMSAKPTRAASRREADPQFTPFPTMALTSQYLDLQGKAKDQNRAVSVLTEAEKERQKKNAKSISNIR
jgi:hypothetical protein